MNSSSMTFVEDAETHEHLSKSQCLELEYFNSLQKEDSIIKDENARRLHLRILLLEDENDELHEQLALEDDHVDGLECERIELQAQIEQAGLDVRQYQAELMVKDRELINMRTELISMNGLSKDSTKLLTEKLSLVRELAAIKPELEHLRSQALYQQTVLAEKLTLERHANTLEAELETAKGSLKRTAAKDIASARDAELQMELDELKKDVIRERREREKSQKATEREACEWENRKAVLEDKVDAMRTKLRTTKEQLKDVQVELAQSIAATSRLLTAPENEVSPANPQKRMTARMGSDTAIGTPDGIATRKKRVGGKRGKQDQASLGEKSMFSVTPYLNRTANVHPGSPQKTHESHINNKVGTEPILGSVKNGSGLIMDIEASATQIDVSPSATARPRPVAKPCKKSVLKALKTDSNDTGAALKSSRAANLLEKVVEEDVDEDEMPAKKRTPGVTRNIQKQSLEAPVPYIEEAEPKKKKRKLLGLSKTIFDEEDGEATKRPTKVVLAPAKSLGKIGGKRNLLKNGLNDPSRGVAAFSPLKKDKRGVQASFLG